MRIEKFTLIFLISDIPLLNFIETRQYSQLSIIRHHVDQTNVGGKSRQANNRTRVCVVSYCITEIRSDGFDGG